MSYPGRPQETLGADKSTVESGLGQNRVQKYSVLRDQIVFHSTEATVAAVHFCNGGSSI